MLLAPFLMRPVDNPTCAPASRAGATGLAPFLMRTVATGEPDFNQEPLASRNRPPQPAGRETPVRRRQTPDELSFDAIAERSSLLATALVALLWVSALAGPVTVGWCIVRNLAVPPSQSPDSAQFARIRYAPAHR
jgi:hypothetical protein